jgi:hypothetical protein
LYSGAANFGIKNREIEHYRIFDIIARILRNTISFQTKYVDKHIKEIDNEAKKEYERIYATKNSKLGFKNAPAFSKLFNIINQTLFSLKAEDIVNRAVQRLNSGRKCVITFQNTMESFMQHLADRENTKIIDTDFSTVMKSGLEQTLYYAKYNSKGQKTKTIKVDLDELDDSAKSKYYEILDDIHKISVGISISPIDYIIDGIRKAGFSVAELTGRKSKIQFLENGKGKLVPRKVENITKAANKFNRNEIDCLLINESGATGISLHAKPNDAVNVFPEYFTTDKAFMPNSLEPHNQLKQRVMIVAQPSLDINTEVQMWGRINRTGQLYPPEYDIMSLAVPAEKRLLLILQRKLRSLDANTTSNQKQNESILNNVDFINKYGDDMVNEWLNNNLDIQEALEYPNKIKVWVQKERLYAYHDEFDGRQGSENCSQKTSGRIAIMPVDEQRRFYDDVTNAYVNYVDDLKQKNEYNLEMQNLPLEAKVIYSHKASEGEETNPFNSAYYTNECDVNNLQKAMTKDEIDVAIEDYLDGKTAPGNQKKMLLEMENYFSKKVDSEVKALNENLANEIEKIKLMPSLLKIKKEEGLEKYKNILQLKIEEAQDERNEKITKKTSELNDSKFNLSRIFNKYLTGRMFNYPDLEEYVDANGNKILRAAYAVFMGYTIDFKKSNPYALSNIRMKFACQSGFRKKEIILSSATAKSELDRVTIAAIQSGNGELNYSKWDDYIKENNKAREKRYIITGNVLKAIKDNYGQLISFNYFDGSKSKGILMPKKYIPNFSITTDIIFIEKLLKNITDKSIEYSSDTDFGKENRKRDGISFMKTENNDFLITLGYSAKNAAKYYKDEEIIQFLQHKQFTQQSPNSSWNAILPKENLNDFLKMVQKNHAPKVVLTSSAYEIIKDDIDDYRKKQKELETTIKLIKLEIKHYKLTKYGNVAGLGNIPEKARNKKDKDISECEKMLSDFYQNIDKQQKTKKLSGFDIEKKAMELDIDFSKIL